MFRGLLFCLAIPLVTDSAARAQRSPKHNDIATTTGQVSSVILSPDGKYVAAQVGTGFSIVDINGQPRYVAKPGLGSYSFSSNDRYLIGNGYQNPDVITIVDVRRGRAVMSFNSGFKRARSFSLSADSKVLVVLGGDGALPNTLRAYVLKK